MEYQPIEIVQIYSVFDPELHTNILYALDKNSVIYERVMKQGAKWQVVLPIIRENLYEELLN